MKLGFYEENSMNGLDTSLLEFTKANHDFKKASDDFVNGMERYNKIEEDNMGILREIIAVQEETIRLLRSMRKT